MCPPTLEEKEIGSLRARPGCTYHKRRSRRQHCQAGGDRPRERDARPRLPSFFQHQGYRWPVSNSLNLLWLPSRCPGSHVPSEIPAGWSNPIYTEESGSHGGPWRTGGGWCGSFSLPPAGSEQHCGSCILQQCKPHLETSWVFCGKLAPPQ